MPTPHAVRLATCLVLAAPIGVLTAPVWLAFYVAAVVALVHVARDRRVRR
jgi:hypothetical protein